MYCSVEVGVASFFSSSFDTEIILMRRLPSPEVSNDFLSGLVLKVLPTLSIDAIGFLLVWKSSRLCSSGWSFSCCREDW